jgi:uncharacterized repeat protein (TIGR01451 family)
MPTKYNSKDYSIKNTFKLFNYSKSIRCLCRLQALFVLLQLILISATASSLNLSGPPDADISGEDAYGMSFHSSEDASSLSALVELAEGFSYGGNAELVWGGKKTSFPPLQSERSLQWDLSPALKFCRHIVINEWEPNPPGSDTRMEWIELYNPSAQAINIGGWRMVDSYYGKSVSIPPNTVIMPDGYQLITWTNGSLVNSYKASISLLDSSGNEIDRTSSVKDDKNNASSWARYPNGRDLDSDMDWMFQAATPGGGNGGKSADIYAGESLALLFNLTAGCSSQSPAQISAEVHTSTSKTSAPPLPLAVRRANLSLLVSPDRFDVALGDVVTWTILMENNGDGTAHNVTANATIDTGLQLVEIDSPQGGLNSSYASLEPGRMERIILKARVISARKSYTSAFTARWGSGPCQEVSLLSLLGPRTALRKTPDQPRSLTVGESVGFKISADLPRGARSLWINDTIPPGLSCNESSLSVQGRAPLEVMVAANSDGTRRIGWFFGDCGPTETIDISYDCQLDNLPENQDGTVLAGTTARMSWNEGVAGRADADECGPLTVVEPDLALEMQADRPSASPNDPVAFTLLLYHSAQSHAPANDIDLQLLLPEGLAYQPGSAQVLAGPAASFDEEGLRWRLDGMDLDWNADQKALLRFNATVNAAPGETIEGHARATWTSLAGARAQERTGAGGENDYLREANASESVLSLALTKTADPDPAPVGEPLTYALTYECLGGTAHNVVIRDRLDPKVALLSAEPAAEESGVWKIAELFPDGPHTIHLTVRVNDTLPDGALLENHYSIGCDELETKSGRLYTPVLNGTLLSVNKTPLQKAVRRGEEASYLITVCNRGGQPATNVTVRDVFASSVEMISAWPEMAEDGAWHYSTLAPGQCVQIALTVRVPRIDVLYQSQENVTGRGFVRSYRDYSTSRQGDVLTNRVYVSSDQMHLSSSANVKILAEEGTELCQRMHGSGDYEDQEDLRFLTENKSIRMQRSMKASYGPTTLLLPKGGSQKVSCLWHDSARARNGITNTTFEESVRYSTTLASESLYDLDKNQSVMQIAAGFSGLAHIGTLKRPDPRRGADIISVEDFAGDFLLSEGVHDLRQGLMMDRTASGLGYAARDLHGPRLRSHESGTGSYRSEERIEAYSGFISKDLQATYHDIRLPVTPGTSLSRTQKWAEGIELTNPESLSLISEQYSSATHLKLHATAASSRELRSEANFSGIATLKAAVVRNGSIAVDREETLMGDYNISRRIIISGYAKYDRPHLYLRKDGRQVEDVALYTITITNDGNTTIGPLFLQDIFPPGARFINATLKPNQIDQNSSNWTLLHLSIGDTLRIGINLNVERCGEDIVNRAILVGTSSLGQVFAQNLSVISQGYLRCCPLTKTAQEENSQGAGCACWDGNAAVANETETDYLNANLMQIQWDGAGEGSCPLNCADAKEDYTPKVSI